MSIRNQITRVGLDAVRLGTFPGCVVGVVSVSGERGFVPVGNFTYDESSAVVREDTMYDTASITKSIPTASLALQLIDGGKMKVTDKLIDHLPEFRNSDRELVLIEHLLTYTLDGYGLSSLGITSLNEASAEMFIETLLTRDFEKRPGIVFKYTNIPAALLGLAIEKVTGKTLDVLADEWLFGPLGMTHSTFYPERFAIEDIVPTEIDDQRGEVRGIVHDESAYICKRGGKIVGHAGLFSNAPDILNFLEMLLNRGTFKGQTYFSESILGQMSTNQIEGLGDSNGLGWELNQPRYMGQYCNEHTFGKTGFTGTLCVVDIKKGLAYVILSNRTYPTRPKDSRAINAFRKQIGEIVLA